MGSIEINRRDGLSSTTAFKGPCRVAAGTPITLFGLQTVDGVALADGDRVLVTANGFDNGIWIVVANGTWRRAADWNKAGDIARGTRVWVTSGNSGPAEMEVSSVNPVPGATAVTFDLSAGNVNAAALSAAAAAAAASAAAAAASAAEAATGGDILPSVLLAKLLTVDGTGSGLDADKLRGTTPTTFGASLLALNNSTALAALLPFVRYDAAQTLTDPQKAQARANIGADAGTDVVRYSAQTLTDAQKAQARTNIGVDAAGGDAVRYGAQSLTPAQQKQARDNVTAANGYKVVNVADFGAVADCTGQGTGTDNTAAFQAAWDYGITNIGNGMKLVIPPGRYRMASGVVFNGGHKHNIGIECQGAITTDNVAMIVFDIRDAMAVRIRLSAFEGGRWASGQANGGYYIDYSTTREAAAAGGQEFVVARGVFDYDVDIHAYGYGGRVLRTDSRVDDAHYQTGAIKGKITSGRNFDLSKPRVAQSLWADTSVIGQGNWGHLERLTCDFDLWGPVWKNWNDISVTEIDTAFGLTGVSFLGCVVVEVGNLYVGSIDGNALNIHVTFAPSAERSSVGEFRVTKMRFLDSGGGVYCKNATNVKIGFLEAGASNARRLIELENCVDVRVDDATGNAGIAQQLYVTGGLSDRIHVKLTTKGGQGDDHIYIAPEVTGTILLDSCNLINAAAGKSLVYVGGSANVFVIGGIFATNNGYCFTFPSGNNVHLLEVLTAPTGSGATLGGSTARTTIGAPNMPTRMLGNMRLNNGSNATGQGAIIQMGIAESALAESSPMVTLRSQLVQAIGSELQGEFQVNIQPYKTTAGASQQAALKLNAPDSSVDTFMWVATGPAGGPYTLRRVRFGPSIPGGASYLYVQ